MNEGKWQGSEQDSHENSQASRQHRIQESPKKQLLHEWTECYRKNGERISIDGAAEEVIKRAFLWHWKHVLQYLEQPQSGNANPHQRNPSPLWPIPLNG